MTTTKTTPQPKQISTVTPFIRTPKITKALLNLRQELEQIAPLDKQIIYADQLLYDVCLALNLSQQDIIEIIGKETDPYNDQIGGN